MTPGAIMESALVALVVGTAAAWAARGLVRRLRAPAPASGCGSGCSACPTPRAHRCHEASAGLSALRELPSRRPGGDA